MRATTIYLFAALAVLFGAAVFLADRPCLNKMYIACDGP